MKSMNTPSLAPVPNATPAPAAAMPASAVAPVPAAPATTARALLKQFQAQFPPFRDCLPLSIGIDKQLLLVLPDLNRKLMRTALGMHTGSPRYLRTMEKATLRYDLDGKPGAEVTATHRAHATLVLQQRFKKEAERKNAERAALDAERLVQAAIDADRARLDKLNLLTAKFSRKG